MTAARIAGMAARPLGRNLLTTGWFHDLAEREFDRRHGVATCGTIETADLTFPDALRGDAVEYSPSLGPMLPLALSRLGVDLGRYAFVDLGCGKGKAMLMASSFPFRRIVGVELADELHRAALANVSAYRSRHQVCREIEVRHGDATQFEFPAEPLVVFMYNPFMGGVMDRVLAGLAETLGQSPRDAVLIYDNPREARRVEQRFGIEPVDGIAPRAGWLIGRLTPRPEPQGRPLVSPTVRPQPVPLTA